MSSDRARRNKVILRVALTVILLGAGVAAVSTLHGMDWAGFGRSLAGVAMVPLAIALAVSTAQVLAQLLRFFVLVRPEARPSLWDLLDAAVRARGIEVRCQSAIERVMTGRSA